MRSGRKITAALLITVCLSLAVSAGQALAAEERKSSPLWLRYPAVSPDGTSIAFTYGGQIWRVAASGGEAVPLTSGEFYSTRPVWSPDGARIAFASRQHGNFDLFIMPVAGGVIKRLTFHSADDLPYAFSPDGKQVYFSSSRLDSSRAVRVGTYVNSDQLYSVPTAGGRSRLIFPAPALDVSADASGRYLLYDNRPVYENEWRKGARSDGTRDIWRYDRQNNSHDRLTDNKGEDRNAVWAPDGRGYYFLSERSGSFNVWSADLDRTVPPVQITTHTGLPVRFLSVARDGAMVYGLGGEIWRRPAGSRESKRVAIHISQSSLEQGEFSVPVLDYASELAVSPDGSQLAVIARGEVFVVAAAGGKSRRITSTPQHEQSISFSPDGKSLLYTSERGGVVSTYEATSEGPVPFLSGGPIKERKVIESAGDTLLPAYSPDGKSIAFLEDRKRIRVFNRVTGSTVTVLPDGFIYSYIDGDISFAWAPDSRWLAATAGSIVSTTDIVLLDAAGKTQPVYISRNGYQDSVPRFSADGKAILWASSRDGLKKADTNAAQFDIYITYLTQESYDAARLTAVGGTPAPAAADREWLPQNDGLRQRTRRLTPFSMLPVLFSMAPDNQSLVIVAQDPSGRAVGYRLGLSNGGLQQLFTKPLSPAGYAADPKMTALYSFGAAGIESTSLINGTSTVIPFQPQIAYNPRGEMEYLFNHFWRLTRQKFYRPDMHGVDWDSARTEYGRFLPHINAWEDFADLMGEMAGGLNASHMGCFYIPKSRFADKTASLGIYFDQEYSGPGLRVTEILPGGPADLAGGAVAVGAVITAIDGVTISPAMDHEELLNNRAGSPIQLTVQRAAGETPVTWTVTPVSMEQALALSYERWVAERRTMTEKLSRGRIGYLHISAMDLDNYQRVFGELFGELRDKDGVVIDIRFNRGGNLHDQLVALFTGESLAGFVNRDGQTIGLMPGNRWTKASALLANASSYSDGSIFPQLYKRQRIGPVIGTGVPGTGTAVWWIDVLNFQIRYGIPQLGARDFTTGWFENQETIPDVYVDNTPEAVTQGRDPQLEAAVASLLESLR